MDPQNQSGNIFLRFMNRVVKPNGEIIISCLKCDKEWQGSEPEVYIRYKYLMHFVREHKDEIAKRLAGCD